MERKQLGNRKSSVLFSSGLMAVLASSFATGASAHAATASSTSSTVKTTKVDNKDSKKKTSSEDKSKDTSKNNSKSEKSKDQKDSDSKDEEVTVVVKSGDTTWSIAKKYDTSVDKIAQDNDLEKNGELILVGQKLEVHPGDKTVEKDSSDSSKDKSKSSQQTAQQSTQSSSTTASASTTAQQTQSSTTTSSAAQSSAPVSQAPTTNTQSSSSSYKSNATGSEASAKEWIAQRESGGSYTAQNGQYYGRYQLSSSYLGGDYSPANQEKVADNYVANRYGSWSNAQAFWQSHGWY